MPKKVNDLVMLKEDRVVTKQGNSLGVNIPTDMLKALNLTKGDEVTLEVEGDILKVKKKVTKTLPEGISDDFLDTLEACFNDYDEVMKELVDK